MSEGGQEFTSQMASSARHEMSLLILIWAVLGCITSDQFR